MGRRRDYADDSSPSAAGRLLARPRPVASAGIESGLHRLRAGGGRDGVLLVPPGYDPAAAAFVLSLHGAGGNAEGGLYPLRDLAERAGILMLSPKSQGQTWDLLGHGLGPDVAAIDELLALAFARVAVDPARTAIAGFSDGASYALSLGIANGGLFPAIMAFSPGFAAPPGRMGTPRIFVSHGTADAVLPIEVTSRRAVPNLERGGYDVRYVEYSGTHAVPSEVASAAVAWFLGGREGMPRGASPG